MLGFGDGKNRAPQAGGVDTLVGAGVVLDGELRFAGGLYLEGRLRGRLLAEDGQAATVTIAPRGRVEGEIRAPVVVIHGTVSGEVHASERLELGPGARVEGRLHYSVIEMSAGAEFTGQLVHQAREAVAAAVPARAGEATPA